MLAGKSHSGRQGLSNTSPQLLKDIAEKLVDEDGVITDHVDSAEHWQTWREMLKQGMDESGYYNLAVFLFCMLN